LPPTRRLPPGVIDPLDRFTGMCEHKLAMLATTAFNDRLCDPAQDHIPVEPALHERRCICISGGIISSHDRSDSPRHSRSSRLTLANSPLRSGVRLAIIKT
jgi:hypothetical protein